jgi:hypothetical protein
VRYDTASDASQEERPPEQALLDYAVVGTWGGALRARMPVASLTRAGEGRMTDIAAGIAKQSRLIHPLTQAHTSHLQRSGKHTTPDALCIRAKCKKRGTLNR